MREGYEEAPPVAEISAADRAMLDFAVKLTRAPPLDDARGRRGSPRRLFAYYNRLADGLGIEPEGLSDP